MGVASEVLPDQVPSCNSLIMRFQNKLYIYIALKYPIETNEGKEERFIQLKGTVYHGRAGAAAGG